MKPVFLKTRLLLAVGFVVSVNILGFAPNDSLRAQDRIQAPQQEQKKAADATSAQATEPIVPSCDEVRSSLKKLTQDMVRVRRRLTELEKDRLINSIQDQLTKEEQRGENLQGHLLEIAEKDAGLQVRLDQANSQLRPERIESMLSGVGSVHPEELREEIKKRLQNEKLRVQVQVDLLRQDRVRTQQSLATTDAAIQRLKIKLAEATKP